MDWQQFTSLTHEQMESLQKNLETLIFFVRSSTAFSMLPSVEVNNRNCLGKSFGILWFIRNVLFLQSFDV